MSGAVRIEVEADPTPLVLSLARALRESAAVPELRDLLTGLTGTVALRSQLDAQAATLLFAEGGVDIHHGVDEGVEAIPLVPYSDYALAETPDELASAVETLLNPPVPAWRDAAASFWAANQGSYGFPEGLRVVCQTEEEEIRFGEDAPAYEVHGPADALAAAFSGRGETFLFAIATGVTVVGSVAHLSAMCGAHWKVRFGV
ncbi:MULTISPECIES: hypothetical protein [Streptomyces]|jgi:hypothetical protein|uniref:Uncharacterized protein n=1 Tax=Streptomyces nymphaeiformis TaxID=2663842 RepID=A0A7W7TYQ1_9ACTN|nr:hypothetical protein [Streptomyces nymphaeiformis]MBB4981673.1 hypothetical protein [Streptomyces nymphaeiformis]